MVDVYVFHVAKYTSPMDTMESDDTVIEKYMAQVSTYWFVLTLYYATFWYLCHLF